MTKRTKIRIRKIVAFIRTSFLVLCLLFLGFTICSVDGPSIVFPLVCFGISVVCFGISLALDELLWQTAWKGDKPSPFIH